MQSFSQWWSSLPALNQWFFIAAAFFSVFFLWQLAMALFGLSGGHDLDSHPDQPMEHDTPQDAAATVMAFKLIGVRSLLAFFTLFTWRAAFTCARMA